MLSSLDDGNSSVKPDKQAEGGARLLFPGSPENLALPQHCYTRPVWWLPPIIPAPGSWGSKLCRELIHVTHLPQKRKKGGPLGRPESQASELAWPNHTSLSVGLVLTVQRLLKPSPSSEPRVSSLGVEELNQCLNVWVKLEELAALMSQWDVPAEKAATESPGHVWEGAHLGGSLPDLVLQYPEASTSRCREAM